MTETLNPALRNDEAAVFGDDPDLLNDFLLESREHLALVEIRLLDLERNPEDRESLNSVFRAFHTLKGLAGFLGATAIQEIAHETENLLDMARSAKLRVTPEVIDAVLRSSDAVTRCLNAAATTRLARLPWGGEDLFLEIERLMASDSPPAAVIDATRETGNPNVSDLPDPPRKHGPAKSGKDGTVLRVEAAKLDHLLDMVGELVIAESVVRNDSSKAASGDPLLSRNLTQLSRVVQEVQKTSMSMRMAPVGTLFGKMGRLVRDLSRKSGKPIDLVTSGDSVELDRRIVEDLADPMVHMIRNSVDHGLETVEERLRAGKPARSTVHLKAMHDAGEIVVEVGDDGRGLDVAKILANARKRGLIREDETPEEEIVFKMIFEPGFSTAERVSDLSGRGVGMDVVRKQVHKLRGGITIRSVTGNGCTFVLRLPLTLAIVDGLVVAAGAQRCIIPMFAVREMFSPAPETFVTIENRAEAAWYREKLLPLIRLNRLLDPGAANPEGGVLVVIEARNQLCCVAVDRLIGKQEVVIRSLGKVCRDVPAISGGAILGDGRVGLVIDVNSLRSQL